MIPAPVQNSAFVASHSCAFCKGFGIFIISVFLFSHSFSQNAIYSESYPVLHTVSNADSVAAFKKKTNNSRTWLVSGINAASYGGSLMILSAAWYRDYDKTPFHVFNDSKEWLQIDKLGHGWSAYNTGRASAALWKWAGFSNKNATLIGGLSGTVYMTVIEFLDAHSSEWGWSWADMAANLFGSGLFIGQQLAWEEQRIQYKFSFHSKKYDDPQLRNRSDELFGSSWNERMLKDYNGQTYWFSFNLKSFFPESKLPAWLSLSVGYGADGMFGGFENIAKDENDNIIFDRRDIARKRQFYLAPDIDLTKIKTDSRFLRTLLSALNALKFPAPAVELTKGKLKLHLIYF